MTYLTKGTVLSRPAGGGYILTEDILERPDFIKAEWFEAFGGAKEVKAGDVIANWVYNILREHDENWRKQNDPR